MSENEIQLTDNETASEIKKGSFEAAASAKEPIKEKSKSVGGAPKAIEESEVEASKEEVPVLPEEISYHAVEKDGEITAIWEMQGQKHLRTISPKSSEGQKIFSLFTSEIHDTDAGAKNEAKGEENSA